MCDGRGKTLLTVIICPVLRGRRKRLQVSIKGSLLFILFGLHKNYFCIPDTPSFVGFTYTWPLNSSVQVLVALLVAMELQDHLVREGGGGHPLLCKSLICIVMPNKGSCRPPACRKTGSSTLTFSSAQLSFFVLSPIAFASLKDHDVCCCGLWCLRTW